MNEYLQNHLAHINKDTSYPATTETAAENRQLCTIFPGKNYQSSQNQLPQLFISCSKSRFLSKVKKKPLAYFISLCYDGNNFITFLNEACRKMRYAAEGVTLSGVRKDKDCKPTELWRNPLSWVPKVQSVHTLISQAKGQSFLPLTGEIFCLRDRVLLHGPFYYS